MQIQFFTFLDMHKLAPMVPWLEYINNILTTDLDQVTENERVIVDEPGKRWKQNGVLLFEVLTICFKIKSSRLSDDSKSYFLSMNHV